MYRIEARRYRTPQSWRPNGQTTGSRLERKRQEHEQAEAKRKAEWEARQRAKEEAEQAAWENAVAMSDDEVMAASMKRVGDDSERLTRRNMKQCVTEYIQPLCLEDVAFARNVMHPRKNMVNCFRYIKRRAFEFAKQEMEDNDVKPSAEGYGTDVPDGLCYGSCTLGRTDLFR